MDSIKKQKTGKRKSGKRRDCKRYIAKLARQKIDREITFSKNGMETLNCLVEDLTGRIIDAANGVMLQSDHGIQTMTPKAVAAGIVTSFETGPQFTKEWMEQMRLALEAQLAASG